MFFRESGEETSAQKVNMSSWVKVSRGQPQKPVGGKRNKPSWIPRLLDINPYKPSQKATFSDKYPRDLEEQNSFEELFGQQYHYPAGTEEYCERYQYSQNDTKYNSDDRREKLYLQFYQQIQNEYHKERPSDCVIVAISKDQMEYATAIGHRLQDHGLVVEMIYLTSESGLTRALQEVKNDGSPFCILVEQSNVALSSCTAIILHDSIKIHRNMPMEDALALVVKAFGKIFGEREQQERNEISHKAADLADDYLERELYESYSVPLDIRHLLFLLSEGKYLYSEELNAISVYLKTRITELEGFEEADTTEEPSNRYETHASSSSTHLEKPPPLLPTPSRNPFLGQSKPSLLGDRPSAGLLPTPGFLMADLAEGVVNALYEPGIQNSGPASDILAKPPPLLPTPGRTPLMGHGKPPLLRERPLIGLLPIPGAIGPKGKPPPLLAMTSKRPGLLGFSPHLQAKRPLLGEKPGLLPTPAGSANPTAHQRPPKPKPLLS
ncbi:nuclear receptor coactivator 5-like [Spea bombifrons]|uniref:nuclear receptor coactivator 5-like n=1 Tax=Spea bombifrons TaxID=233779 RepID=UPI00234A2BA3|nr:nuclear receptor coactivator 5-like [Spea bombifrons]